MIGSRGRFSALMAAWEQYGHPLSNEVCSILRRMLPLRITAIALLLSACRSTPLVDPNLSAEIARIKAIDNHAHPVRAMPKGQQDHFFDALPVDNMEPASDPLALRPGAFP